MLEIIGNLVRNLVIIVFVATLIQLLVPRGVFRRYVQMVVGLIIILLLLTPLRQILLFEDDLPPVLPLFDFREDSLLENEQQESFLQEQHAMVLQSLNDRIIAEANARLSLSFALYVEEGMVELVEDESDPAFGSIKEMSLWVGEGKEKEEQKNTTAIQPVEPVQVVINDDLENLPEEKKESKRLPEAENMLAEHFQIAPERVYVEKYKSD